ncbi:hypothetical protein HY213_04880 [Candidatus Peregrinibacteria bacterium]|nr:hypothetical protein [Candidatus Peregrinibacteria bacterium]
MEECAAGEIDKRNVKMLARALFSSKMFLMIYSKKNAGKWVASRKGKVLATDVRLAGVLRKVKDHDKDSLQLAFVPKTPFLAGFHAI